MTNRDEVERELVEELTLCPSNMRDRRIWDALLSREIALRELRQGTCTGNWRDWDALLKRAQTVAKKELARAQAAETALREAREQIKEFQQENTDVWTELEQVRELLREVIPDYERVTKMNHARASRKQIEWVERALAVLSPPPAPATEDSHDP